MSITRIEDPSEYTEKIESIRAINEKYILFFIASLNQNNQFWCPDVQQAYPIVQQALADSCKNDTLPLVECVVERSQYRGNPDYFYRTAPEVKLTAIPTLISYQNGLETKRLVEGELHNLSNVQQFFADAS
eukprot:TRINITY_DN12376_c0_g1_i1.p1 TRINITY_DN12376_c0_g1~~TRINITY_DN12376_c0_g1_i1.p1  ORF type:complete len:131 (-),score=20.78 TRINITY_DN12376_c0_g1_i1:11-403(-)